MIDTDKYEGHTSDWKWIDISEQDDFHLHSEHGDIINHDTPDGKLAQDAPLLLAEVKRLRKLEAAVVGSWMRACDHRGPWHKALRYPCVELGYLTLDGHYFELSEEYQNMAKEWIREQNGDEEE